MLIPADNDLTAARQSTSKEFIIIRVFATVRAISPMAPALDAMRSLITGSSGTAVSVFQLVFWLLVGLAASAVAIIRRRTTTIAELIDP